MSHFTVLVVGKIPEDVEDQLAPYQENNMGDCPEEFLQFEDKEDYLKEQYNTGKCNEFSCASSCSWGQSISKENFDIISKGKVGDKIVLTITKSPGLGLGYFRANEHYHCYNGSINKCPTEHVWVKVNKIIETTHPDPNVCFDGKIEVELVENPKKVPFKKLYKTFDEFCKKWEGYSERDKKTGRYGYWHNPNSKWDYYQIGGRWAGYFKLKNGAGGMVGTKSWCNKGKEIPSGRVDQAKKGDIDFDCMRAENFEKYSRMYDEFEALMKTNPQEAKNNAYWKFGIQNQDDKDNFVPETREKYLKRHSNPSTFAVIKDGKWYEKGQMGWWAMVSNEKDAEKWDEEFEKLLADLPDDALLTVVDCHI